ncbi:hypothetical protein P879_05896 [Paragonimus westermani]|uniref:tRNA nucleotidyltransferase (CCA-adding enzyme) n=1 Tax=Paragonimus westermani TaxID=34504 RepID=A0A8T0DRH3_9TREM|nr:hypothetical protein P879_05896 [Paragonimus westermani]
MLLKSPVRIANSLSLCTRLIGEYSLRTKQLPRFYGRRCLFSHLTDQHLRAMTLEGDTHETEQLIDLTPFPTLYREENVVLHNIFTKYGFELRMAGGAVRDVLLGIEPKDIDFATDAIPSQMHEMFSKENIRLLNRNGEAHGTVTVRINDKINFEITTLRIDSEPDGRHSKVVFTDDWKLDAARRDLTVNSMFLKILMNTVPDFSRTTETSNSIDSLSCTELVSHLVRGRVYDFFGGRTDLKHRHIRFVGDPESRIREDYLRILRYFRFHGRLAKPNEMDVHDPETLKVIKANGAGLARIAGERCWAELRNILLYPSTPLLLRRMFETELFPYLGLPENPNFTELDSVFKRGVLNRNPNSATVLAGILSSVEEVETLNQRLKLSNFELMILLYIIKHREQCANLQMPNVLQHYQRELLLSKEAPNKIRPVITEMLSYIVCDPDLLVRWSAWEPPRFPVNGHELLARWSLPPRAVGTHLAVLRQQWVDSDCSLTSDELLSDGNRTIVETSVCSVEREPLKPKAKKARR